MSAPTRRPRDGHPGFEAAAMGMTVLGDGTPHRLGLIGTLRGAVETLSPVERARVFAMYGSILVLHAVGFFVFIAFVVPAHYKGLGIGVSVLAYTLGLRHAFDADHISAIDNTTRKLMHERQGTDTPRPLSLGYFFSLGHSTIVIAIGVGIIVAEKTALATLTNGHSGIETFGGVFGTTVSATFLFLVGTLNLIVFGGIVRVFRAMRGGCYDEAELELQLVNRGFFSRLFGRWMKTISKGWQMYPVGVMFGMGFDTATEVALLATTALYASHHVPWYAIICLPILFTAGMSLMDTTDGIFMNVAYGWAFVSPVRKIYYNLTVTGLSVAICFFIGGIEILGMFPAEVHSLPHDRGFWGFMYGFNINTAGFVIVGMFVVTWVSAMAVWRFGRIEERWGARLAADAGTLAEQSPGWPR